MAIGLIIFMAGLSISIYAARYGVDMDLLTRGAGFGYIGFTLTSLIYASFTFIFLRSKRRSWPMHWSWRWAFRPVGAT